jgi:hypothetical protein
MDELRFIHAAYALLPGEVEAESNVRRCHPRELELEVMGRRLRRIGNVSRLAAVASRACFREYPRAPKPDGLGVFHGTSMGDMHATLEAFEQATTEGELKLSPINFANAVGNMTLFHAASANDAYGPSLLVTQEDFSFEGALRAALDHGATPRLHTALVGGSDGFAPPRAGHETRIDVGADVVLGEGSAWIALDRTREGALGEWLDVGFVATGDGALDELGARVHRSLENAEETSSPALIPGLRIGRNDVDSLRSMLGDGGMRPYLDRTGWYPTASAVGVVLALKWTRKGARLHVSHDSAGNLSYMLFRV